MKFLANDRGPDAPPWTDRSHGNIGSSRGYDAIVEERLSWIDPTDPARPILREKGPEPVNKHGISVRENVQFLHTLLNRRRQQTRVHDAKPRLFQAKICHCRLIGVQDLVDGTVS